MKKYGRERLKQIFEAAGLPKNTKFKGYVLHLPEKDEFMNIINYGNHQNKIQYAWMYSPEKALIFKKHIKAVKELQEYNKHNITLCLLFDIGPQLLILPERSALEILGLI